MLILGTLFEGAIAKMTQLSFIDYRLFPGGPGSYIFHLNSECCMYTEQRIAAFEEDEFSIPIDEISNVSYVIANWLADGMVVRIQHPLPYGFFLIILDRFTDS